MQFKLIRHKKFGPGVILSSIDATYRIYFKDKVTRTLLSSPMFYEDEKVSLDEFIRFELYEGIFDKFTKTKAEPYINKEHIERISLQDNKISGVVNGTCQYFVSLLMKNNVLTMDCDCPVRGLCKHEYAFCKTLKERYFKTVNKETSNNEVKEKLSFSEYEVDAIKRLKNFDSLDIFVNVLEKLNKFNKKDYLDYLMIIEKKNDPRNDSLIFYALSPLFYDEKIKAFLYEISKDNVLYEDLLKKGKNIFDKNYVNPSDNFKVLSTVLKAIISKDIDILFPLTSYKFYSNEFIIYAYVYLLSLKEYPTKKLYEIANTDLFKDLYYNPYREEIKKLERNQIAFIKSHNLDYQTVSLFETNELIPFLSLVDSESMIISYLINNFKKIRPDNYQILVNNLYSYYLKTTDSNVIDIIEKLPNSTYLVMLFKNRKYKRY